MQTQECINLYLSYLKNNTRPNTYRTFSYVLNSFNKVFSECFISDIKENQIITFLQELNVGCSSSTKNHRLSIIRSFFNFIIDTADLSFINPCSRSLIKKMFKKPKMSPPNLLDKDLIDEIIYRTTNKRDRLILELMGRAGMRISEVLNIKVSDIDFNDLTIRINEPKSGKPSELVYITKKLGDKLTYYVNTFGIQNGNLFNISYSTTYRMVRRAGLLVSSYLSPHDLRRHTATQASRNNVPLEIISRVILRHSNMSTTQRYLGSLSPVEIRRWII